MSDNWLKFVPIDPTYRPSQAAAQNAISLMTSFAPLAEKVSMEFYSTIQFIDPGGNWSGVNCPSCGADAEKWWGAAMSAAYEAGFSDLNVTAGCCGARVSLNELAYVWRAAFASFIIEALNPGILDLTPVQEQELAACLGCKLTKIWVHL